MADRTSLTPLELVRAIGGVALGGALGTLARDLCLKWSPAVAAGASWTQHIPWVLLAINLVGVYGATWALRGPLRHREPNDSGRLVAITGFFGGFTSYSSLFVSLAVIWHLSVAGAVLTGTGAVLSGVVVAAVALRASR